VPPADQDAFQYAIWRVVPSVERGEAAGLAPHAVGDLPLEPERLGGQRVEVDRVVVPGDSGVAASQVAGQLPLNAGARHQVEGFSFGLRRLVAATYAQVRRGRLPHGLAAAADLGDEVEDLALRVGAQVLRGGRDVEGLRWRDRTMLGDRVAQVHRADGRVREGAVGHDPHVQREGQHMRVGDRERVAQREAADLGVGGDVGRVGDDALEAQVELRDLTTAAGDERQQRGARDHRRRGAGVERQDAGGAVEGSARHLRPPAGSGRRRGPCCR